MKTLDIFYMLGVIFYFSIGVISTELYEKRLSNRKKGKGNLKATALATLGGIFWIVVLPVDFLLNQICWKHNKNKQWRR